MRDILSGCIRAMFILLVLCATLIVAFRLILWMAGDVDAAQTINTRDITYDRTLSGVNWPTSNRGINEHVYMLDDPHIIANFIESEQDFIDFMRAQCEDTNAWWRDRANHSHGIKRDEAFSWIRDCSSAGVRDYDYD